MLMSKKLKQLRKQKKVTQTALADYLGISQQAVQRWERGVSKPPTETLPKLANYFGVHIDDLFGEDKKEYGDDERKLLNGYRTLDDAEKQTLFNMLAFLRSPQGKIRGM